MSLQHSFISNRHYLWQNWWCHTLLMRNVLHFAHYCSLSLRLPYFVSVWNNSQQPNRIPGAVTFKQQHRLLPAADWYMLTHTFICVCLHVFSLCVMSLRFHKKVRKGILLRPVQSPYLAFCALSHYITITFLSKRQKFRMFQIVFHRNKSAAIIRYHRVLLTGIALLKSGTSRPLYMSLIVYMIFPWITMTTTIALTVTHLSVVASTRFSCPRHRTFTTPTDHCSSFIWK